MELSEALPILRRLYAPLFQGMDLRICDDHICDRDHEPGKCPLPDSAKYTKMDALLDTPERLDHRLPCGVWYALGASSAAPLVRVAIRVDPHHGESFDFGGVPVHHFIAAVSEQHDEMGVRHGWRGDRLLAAITALLIF